MNYLIASLRDGANFPARLCCKALKTRRFPAFCAQENVIVLAKKLTPTKIPSQLSSDPNNVNGISVYHNIVKNIDFLQLGTWENVFDSQSVDTSIYLVFHVDATLRTIRV